MTESVIAYDRSLPEIPGRCPWEKPDCYLVKDDAAQGGWRVENAGRRPSQLLLVRKLRKAVDAWRDAGYAGASDTTRRLFEYWFNEDHQVDGFRAPFRYHFCQREAIETLAYVVEVFAKRDSKELIQTFGDIRQKDLFNKTVAFSTSMDGRRRIRRYIAELNAEGEQDLPPEALRRYAFKMATGSGKTWVMVMAIVWSYFQRTRERNAEFSTNFLVLAPNVIVFQRLEKDFGSNRIFSTLPVVPPEWRSRFRLKVILRGDTTEPDPSGNLVLTNIQQIYEARSDGMTPLNAVDALLGRKPARDLASYQRSMLERLLGLKDLVVLNDEAHHVHEEELVWTKTLLSIHKALPTGLGFWLDFSATPKDQNGMYFPWTLTDYPLAQAVEDRIVKAPIIVTKQDDPLQPKKDPEIVTHENVAKKYGYWIHAAVVRWKEHQKSYRGLGLKSVLFIMAEKNLFADAIGDHLLADFGFKKGNVLVIHTDRSGDVLAKDLDSLRKEARDIDGPDSRVQVIVSVMMLREGWDVRSVSVVLGLRPFNAKSEILPEQVIGRGLRLMSGGIPDRTQTLEVLGTRNLLDFLRKSLEAEGVGVGTDKKEPVVPINIEPVLEKKAFDILLPLSKPRLTHNVAKLSSLDVSTLDPIFEAKEIAEEHRIRLRMEFATIDVEVHKAVMAVDVMPGAINVLAALASKVQKKARLTGMFEQLVPIVKLYVASRCFGGAVSLDDKNVCSHLQRIELQEQIATYLARRIGELTLERRELELENAGYRLSHVKPFSWRRDLPLLKAKRTIFNYVATYNSFERRFAEFLDRATDVLRFAALGTTEQGDSGSEFKVDYLKPLGAIGFYHPDWVVVQTTPLEGEVNWILETKGRVWPDTASKDAAMKDWCERVTRQTGKKWCFERINQSEFDAADPKSLSGLMERRAT